MSILTLEFFGVLGVSIKCFLSKTRASSDLGLVKSIGLLSLVTGVLGQVIGLLSALSTIEQIGSVSQAMLAGGLKVSFITTCYGLIIYLLSLLIAIVLTNPLSQATD